MNVKNHGLSHRAVVSSWFLSTVHFAIEEEATVLVAGKVSGGTEGQGN